MKKRRDPSPDFDLFLPIMGDLPLKDQRETMERPFFSLQKRKRVKPIEYTSPDGATWVKIEAIGPARDTDEREGGRKDEAAHGGYSVGVLTFLRGPGPHPSRSPR